MSRFFNERPELAEEIARLPMSEQNAPIRDAMHSVYDPDRIRDEYEERIHCHRDLSTSAGEGVVPPHGSGSTSPAVEPCPACGAPPGVACASTCEANR